MTEMPVRRPRVLLVIDSLAPGGAERSTIDLLPPLAERGFDLELATLHARPGLQDEARDLGFAVHEAEGRSRASWLRWLSSLLVDREPDLVHTTLFEADLVGRCAAYRRRVPAVSTMATERYGPAHLGTGNVGTTKVRLSQLADAVTARLTRRLHAVSEHVADSTARALRYPRDRIDVVYRGRPAELADPRPSDPGVALRASLGVGERQLVLVASRHDEAKGIDRVIDAWPAVLEHRPGSILLVAGNEGRQTAALHAATARIGVTDSVMFLGHRRDVDDLLRVADVFVLPSRREGLPGSLLEAMAAGTPAVVSDLPQVREVVGPDAAVIVDAGDPRVLGQGIVEVLGDADGSRRRAARARQRFLATFTLDRAADGMAEFYSRAVAMVGRRG